MTEYLIRRLLQSALTLFLVTVLTFGLIHAAPGGPVSVLLAPGQTPEFIEQQKKNLGLDKPVPVQYVQWIGRMAKGDLGMTFKGNQQVADVIGRGLRNTFKMMLPAVLIYVLTGTLWGIYNSTRQYGTSDNIAAIIGYAGFAMPAFWFGIILQMIFAVQLDLLPLSDMYSPGHEGELGSLIQHLILPVSVLVLINLAGYLRFSRASMLDVLGQDYIRTARAKGVSERKVMFRHALRNAMIPIVTLLGLELPSLVVGATLTETVFNWPGMGRLFLENAITHEYNVLMGITILTSVMVIMGNLLADILYAVVDPRVQLGARGGGNA